MDTLAPPALISLRGILNRISDDPARQRAFVCLAAFLVAFLLIRTSARMTRAYSWWPGGVKTESGVHLHHFVWGIFLMLGAGFLSIGLAVSPGVSLLLAGLFGTGAGLVLDEFALWTRLEDVYWAEEGRSSVEAVAVVGVFGALIVLGVQPFDFGDPLSTAVTGGVIAVPLLVAVGAILKGRIIVAAIGVFVLPVGLWAMLRVGRPTSPWAHWFYGEGSTRMRKAQARFEDPERPAERLRLRVMDAVAGAPSRG